MSDFIDFEGNSYKKIKKSKKILIVDDITYVIKSISRILSKEGYFVITSKTGNEALTKFKNYSPDLVTIDQKLPDMSGNQLVGKIRSMEGGDKTKILFISAVQDKKVIKSILNAGIEDYLLKPFRKEQLLDSVIKLIGKSYN